MCKIAKKTREKRKDYFAEARAAQIESYKKEIKGNYDLEGILAGAKASVIEIQRNNPHLDGITIHNFLHGNTMAHINPHDYMPIISYVFAKLTESVITACTVTEDGKTGNILVRIFWDKKASKKRLEEENYK